MGPLVTVLPGELADYLGNQMALQLDLILQDAVDDPADRFAADIFFHVTADAGDNRLDLFCLLPAIADDDFFAGQRTQRFDRILAIIQQLGIDKNQIERFILTGRTEQLFPAADLANHMGALQRIQPMLKGFWIFCSK